MVYLVQIENYKWEDCLWVYVNGSGGENLQGIAHVSVDLAVAREPPENTAHIIFYVNGILKIVPYTTSSMICGIEYEVEW